MELGGFGPRGGWNIGGWSPGGGGTSGIGHRVGGTPGPGCSPGGWDAGTGVVPGWIAHRLPRLPAPSICRHVKDRRDAPTQVQPSHLFCEPSPHPSLEFICTATGTGFGARTAAGVGSNREFVQQHGWRRKRRQRQQQGQRQQQEKGLAQEQGRGRTEAAGTGTGNPLTHGPPRGERPAAPAPQRPAGLPEYRCPCR